MRRAIALVLGLSLAVSAALTPAPPAGATEGPPWPEHLPRPDPRGHRDLMGDSPATLPPHLMQRHFQPPLAAEVPGPIVKREVWGYLPYWEMDYTFPHWELLTIVAWFSANMDATGKIVDYNGWGGTATQNLVDEGHANGVKVIATVTNFSNTAIGTLVNSATNRAKAIESCLALMAMHGADGINIDFEFVPASGKAGFVTFMKDLKKAVAEVQPNGWEGHVSLAGPSIDWNGSYDYDELLIHTDGIMVMAYGYHWKGGTPGPLSPLETGDLWKSRSIAWTIDDYLTWGGVENRHKIVIGLPFYGNEWPVANTNVPATYQGDGISIFFNKAMPEALEKGRQWEDVSKTPYYHVTRSGKLKQVWYDDEESLTHKIAYVDAMDLGGIGIWALGYDAPYEDLWNAVASVLVPEDEDEEPVVVDEGPGEDDLGPVWPDEGDEVEAVEPVAVVEDVADAGGTEPELPGDDAPDAEPWLPDTLVADAATGDASGASSTGKASVVGRPGASSHARIVEGDQGCAAGGSGPASGLVASLGLLAAWTLRRRRCAG